MIQHAETCTLYSVHWLRHAIAAAGLGLQPDADTHVDRVSAVALTDTLGHFAELPDWEKVTLKDVADHATLLDTLENRERFRRQCTCDAFQ